MRVEPVAGGLCRNDFLPPGAGGAGCHGSAIRGKRPSAGGRFAGAADFIRNCGTALQTLSIYGAAGIASLGWMLSRVLHFHCARYLPLWFFSALFIYNIDRLKTDPADLINIPARSRSAQRLRGISRALAVISGVALVLIPILECDWLMLLLTAGGAVVCVNYSAPLLGFRFKDVPFLKSFFAPTLVTCSFLAPPLLQQPRACGVGVYVFVALWTWCITMFNMLLCDLRDIDGDAKTGIRSLPVAIGRRKTVFVLIALLVSGVFCSIAVLFENTGLPWRMTSLVMPVYLAALLVALRKRVTEGFYEWWGEGILFVPAVAFLLGCWPG